MDFALFGLFLLTCAAAATTGAVFKPGSWYKQLEKPTWTPPDWVFPVVWTSIYLLISFAGMRVAVLDGNAYAMGFWAAQAAFSTLWTPIFFGMRRLKGAFGVIVPLWLTVAGATWTHMQLDIWAGLAFVPYLVWVTVAAALNFTIWRMNPDVVPIEPSEI